MRSCEVTRWSTIFNRQRRKLSELSKPSASIAKSNRQGTYNVSYNKKMFCKICTVLIVKLFIK